MKSSMTTPKSKRDYPYLARSVGPNKEFVGEEFTKDDVVLIMRHSDGTLWVQYVTGTFGSFKIENVFEQNYEPLPIGTSITLIQE